MAEQAQQQQASPAPLLLEQQLREAAAAIRSLQGRMEAQEAELVGLRSSARARVDTLDTELGLPEQTAAPSQQLQKGLVDTRQLRKPEKFSGDPGSFDDWSFVFEAYMSCVDRRYIALFDRVRFSDTPWSNRMMTGVECELSVQLYYTLAMLLQGRALDLWRPCV